MSKKNTNTGDERVCCDCGKPLHGQKSNICLNCLEIALADTVVDFEKRENG